MDPAWARHLPPGTAPESVDLLGAGSLPAAWAATWAREPRSPALFAAGRWVSAAELDARSRTAAGRFARAGLQAGDRIVMSAATSADLVVAHVGALRLGLVVVPVNGA
jgi:malonyl-CoA/methylmalonyl-CoA synthetase